MYEQKSRTNGITDPNSGGNVVILAPSLWFSTQRVTIQAAIAPIISQHLFGNQCKDSFVISCNFSWKFS